MELGFSIENFSHHDSVRIVRRAGLVESPVQHVELHDPRRRPLYLLVKIAVKHGGSLKASVV